MNGVERKTPTRGVRYFAQGAQTLLLLMREGPWLLRASKLASMVLDLMTIVLLNKSFHPIPSPFGSLLKIKLTLSLYPKL
jgi:hypothetical protein